MLFDRLILVFLSLWMYQGTLSNICENGDQFYVFTVGFVPDVSFPHHCVTNIEESRTLSCSSFLLGFVILNDVLHAMSGRTSPSSSASFAVAKHSTIVQNSSPLITFSSQKYSAVSSRRPWKWRRVSRSTYIGLIALPTYYNATRVSRQARPS